MALVVCFLCSTAAGAAVLTVGQGESISVALGRAGPGDTLRLTGSEYRENIVIDVPVILTGVGMPVIRGGYQGNVVHITAPGTVLDGIHVSEAGERLTKDMAGILVEADSVIIRNCLVSDTLCLLALISVKAGRKLTWDPQAERFVNDNSANIMLQPRPCRGDWKLPSIGT